MDNPKISVIIPVFNPGKYFIPCLDSIVHQTYRNLEIILIDDGSTDGSAKVCDDYAAKDDRIIVLHQPNGGVSRARNAGLEIATGDMVNFPDSDDFLALDTYAYLLQQMEASGAEAICFEYYITYADREIRHFASDGRYGMFDTETSIYELLFSNRSFLCTKLLPMAAVRNVRFLEDIYRDVDTMCCMLSLQNVGFTRFVDRPLYHYVQSEESACRGKFRPSQLSAVKAIPIMEAFLQEHYPGMLKKWRCNYLHLMVMLYCDMYFDDKDYREEKQMIYNVFCDLRKKIDRTDLARRKDRIKFALFEKNPELFSCNHMKIHQL